MAGLQPWQCNRNLRAKGNRLVGWIVPVHCGAIDSRRYNRPSGFSAHEFGRVLNHCTRNKLRLVVSKHPAGSKRCGVQSDLIDEPIEQPGPVTMIAHAYAPRAWV